MRHTRQHRRKDARNQDILTRLQRYQIRRFTDVRLHKIPDHVRVDRHSEIPEGVVGNGGQDKKNHNQRLYDPPSFAGGIFRDNINRQQTRE